MAGYFACEIVECLFGELYMKLIKMWFLCQTMHVGLFNVAQTGFAKRLGSDAGTSAVSSNGPKQTSGPPIRDSTPVSLKINV